MHSIPNQKRLRFGAGNDSAQSQKADRVAKFGQQSNMKRAAQPEELAPAYFFLAAPTCSSYITGEILPVVGGY